MQHSKVEFANTWVIKYSVIQKNAQVNYAIMHIESWFCIRARMLDCLVCLINSWISYLNQIFIWSSFNHDIPFLGFLSLLVLGKVMWETKPLLEYFVSKRRRATLHWLEFQQNTFNQVLVIKYKEDEKMPKVFFLSKCRTYQIIKSTHITVKKTKAQSPSVFVPTVHLSIIL